MRPDQEMPINHYFDRKPMLKLVKVCSNRKRLLHCKRSLKVSTQDIDCTYSSNRRQVRNKRIGSALLSQCVPLSDTVERGIKLIKAFRQLENKQCP